MSKTFPTIAAATFSSFSCPTEFTAILSGDDARVLHFRYRNGQATLEVEQDGHQPVTLSMQHGDQYDGTLTEQEARELALSMLYRLDSEPDAAVPTADVPLNEKGHMLLDLAIGERADHRAMLDACDAYTSTELAHLITALDDAASAARRARDRKISDAWARR